jgi:hypothetical protein
MKSKEITQTSTETSIRAAEMDVSGLRRVPGSIPKTALLILVVEVRCIRLLFPRKS